MIKTAIIVLLVLAAGVPAQQSQTAAPEVKPGVVEGVVVNQLSGAPIRRAEVRLFPIGQQAGPGQGGQMGPGAMGPGGMRMIGAATGARGAVTDSEGRFRLENVAPGEYRVSHQRAGFIAPRVSSLASRNDVVKVGEGETVHGLRFTMLPQAVLAGRVVDEDGEPMQGVSVNVMARGAQRGGSRQFRPFRSNATDDRGEFRIADVAPGKVILAVRPMDRMSGMLPLEQPDGGPPVSYVTTYYPGVIDPSQAIAIEVKPGLEIANLDVTLRRTRVFSIRGRVIDQEGDPPQRFMAMAIPISPDEEMMSAIAGRPGRDGRFEISNLPPGDYTIVVNEAGRGGQGGAPAAGFARVGVGSQNVEGVVIQMQPGFDVGGKVAIEGSGEKPAIGSLRVMLSPAEQIPFMGGVRPGAVKEDGSFVLAGVLPAKYQLMPMNTPQGLYLSSIRIGGQEFFGRDLDLTSGAPGAIQMVFRTDGGVVNGTADLADYKDAANPPTAVILPADESLREAIPARSVQVSSTGTFETRDLRPGEYLVWVFDFYDSSQMLDAEFLRGIESKAAKIRVAAAQTANPQLKLTTWPEPY